MEELQDYFITCVHRLSRKVLIGSKKGKTSKEVEQVIMLSTMCFIFNPASIFTSALYTESLYVFWTFLGLNILYSRVTTADVYGRNLIIAALPFCLATATRANGKLYNNYMHSY